MKKLLALLCTVLLLTVVLTGCNKVKEFCQNHPDVAVCTCLPPGDDEDEDED